MSNIVASIHTAINHQQVEVAVLQIAALRA
jgi:hypothetical protein